MPCPQGIPVQLGMIFESFVKRMPPGRVAKGPAKQLLNTVPNCTECGDCERKCPYDLTIIETLKRARKRAEEFAAE